MGGSPRGASGVAEVEVADRQGRPVDPARVASGELAAEDLLFMSGDGSQLNGDPVDLSVSAALLR